MVKYRYIAILLLIFTISSCQSINKTHHKLRKEVAYFDKNNFKGINFSQLYIKEQEYRKGQDFNIGKSKVQNHYLRFYEDGTVFFFVQEYKDRFYDKNKVDKTDFDGVLIKERNCFFIKRVQAFKMNMGYGIEKVKLEIKQNKIYIQDKYYVYVYTLVE